MTEACPRSCELLRPVFSAGAALGVGAANGSKDLAGCGAAGTEKGAGADAGGVGEKALKMLGMVCTRPAVSVLAASGGGEKKAEVAGEAGGGGGAAGAVGAAAAKKALGSAEGGVKRLAMPVEAEGALTGAAAGAAAGCVNAENVGAGAGGSLAGGVKLNAGAGVGAAAGWLKAEKVGAAACAVA